MFPPLWLRNQWSSDGQPSTADIEVYVWMSVHKYTGKHSAYVTYFSRNRIQVLQRTAVVEHCRAPWTMLPTFPSPAVAPDGEGQVVAQLHPSSGTCWVRWTRGGPQRHLSVALHLLDTYNIDEGKSHWKGVKEVKATTSDVPGFSCRVQGRNAALLGRQGRARLASTVGRGAGSCAPLCCRGRSVGETSPRAEPTNSKSDSVQQIDLYLK